MELENGKAVSSPRVHPTAAFAPDVMVENIRFHRSLAQVVIGTCVTCGFSRRYRPSSTGIVKDDASPPFMSQWLKMTTDF